MVEVKFKTKSSLQVMFTSMVEMKIKTKSRIQIMFTSMVEMKIKTDQAKYTGYVH